MTLDRRSFVAASSAVASTLLLPRRAFGIGRPDADPIRIGVIGLGGRGTGAARDAVAASDNVKIVAVGDLFPDRLASGRAQLQRVVAEDARFAAGYDVPDDRAFSGVDAWKQVLAQDIDLVILATPPAFRPEHLAGAIAAGKHVFMEKPVCVDVAGALSIIASSDAAARKGLGIVAGTQRRHDPQYVETIRRLQDGAIGELVTAQVYWNQGGLWSYPRQPDWSDAEFQLRNWLYYTWLSGDHIVEQHVHNIDVANWVMGTRPVRATGMGGRQVRTDPLYGHIYDHFAIEFEYPGGQRVLSMCRQQDGTASFVGERIVGTKGTSNARNRIDGATTWRHPETPGMNPYVEEHRHLVASIRAGTPLNEGRRIAESTLTAIMGREAAYTGQAVTWDELLASGMDITPKPFALGPLATPPVPTPGQTQLARTFDQGW